MTPTPIEQDCR